MARFVRATQLIRAFKQSATPTVAQGLNLDDTWVDTDDHSVWVCTSLSPVTFTQIGSGGGGGSGTVTSVSVTTVNGVSGSVATATSTPAISLTLGAITPTSVAASGTVTGSNLSGTNTGDQTNVSGSSGSCTGNAATATLAATVTTNANLTGPVTSIGNATAIADGAISNAMLANSAVANLSGTNTGDQINISGNAATVTTNANLTGDVTSVGNATTIGAGKVTEAMQILANNTTNNVSTTKHGYCPILPNDATKYLDGTGTFSTPAGGGGGSGISLGKAHIISRGLF